MAGSAQAPSAPRVPTGTGLNERGARDIQAGEGRAQLVDLQRVRLVAATVDVVAEQGLAAATVARIVARAGVSRRTFYDHFADREECFLAAFDDSTRRLAAAAVPAYRAGGAWPDRLRAALTALLEALACEHGAARVAVVEALGAGPRALERRRRVLEQLAVAIERDGGAAARGGHPPPLTAEGVIGGVFALIHARLLDPDPSAAPLSEMLGSLVAMVVLPYLGSVAARRELDRPAPPTATARAPRSADPLRDLHMRLTYRTLRVLLAVGELGESALTNGSSRPRPSNRVVGEAAGIRDQGQISKLLARLEQLNLVRNTVDRRVKGEANAWVLTERGEAVRAVLPA